MADCYITWNPSKESAIRWCTSRTKPHCCLTTQQQQTVHAPLAAVLLSEALRKTPVRRADETPARLCSGKPPYGLMGDPSQLGSGEVANFSRLRGAARAQAHVQLCMRTARRMQARNLESVGNKNPFPMGATCAIVGSSGSLTRRPRACDRRAPRRDAL